MSSNKEMYERCLVAEECATREPETRQELEAAIEKNIREADSNAEMLISKLQSLDKEEMTHKETKRSEMKNLALLAEEQKEALETWDREHCNKDDDVYMIRRSRMVKALERAEEKYCFCLSEIANIELIYKSERTYVKGCYNNRIERHDYLVTKYTAKLRECAHA